MKLTEKDAYIFGYLAGIIDKAAQKNKKSNISFDTTLQESLYHPYVGFTKIYTKAQKCGLIDKTLDNKIGIALDELDISLAEKVDDYLSPDLQGVWAIAYWKGKTGADFNPPKAV